MDQEAARDLVRAREDCRGDLMRARRRLSKLLLRHGIVYYGGNAWTRQRDQWLRNEALPQLPTRPTRGQPTPAPPLGHVHRPPQTLYRRQRRHRPRARRLVLVPGSPRQRLKLPPELLRQHPNSVAARGVTRDRSMSSPLQGDARY